MARQVGRLASCAMSMDAIRRDFQGPALDVGDIGGDPLAFFQRWYAEAEAIDPHAATTMSLATVAADGGPDVRLVLLRGVDADGGFRFYSSRDSAKGAQLRARPQAALAGHWPALDRQWRVRGRVEELPRAAVVEYFSSRPRLSQLAAACAVQGSELADRDGLQRAHAALAAQLGGAPVPVPEHWTGWRVLAQRIEFWQGQPGRLHDRVECTREGDAWLLRRLAP